MKTYKSTMIALGISIIIGSILAIISDVIIDMGVYSKLLTNIGEMIAVLSCLRMYSISVIADKIKISDARLSFWIVSLCEDVADILGFFIIVMGLLIFVSNESYICDFYEEFAYPFCTWMFTIIPFIMTIFIYIDKYKGDKK